MSPDLLLSDQIQPSPEGYQPVSGTYAGQRGAYRLELRVDLSQDPEAPYQPLGLVSGDLFRDTGRDNGGGKWDYRYSFIVEHPSVRWGRGEVAIVGDMTYYRHLEPSPDAHVPATRQTLNVLIPLALEQQAPLPATAHIVFWGMHKMTFLCEKVSDLFRTIDLEIDRITGTKLPRRFQTQTMADRPLDLPDLDLDIASAYQRAGIDMRIIADDEVFAPTEAGDDLKWDEGELHNAMEHHFSQWRDGSQWKLYLLIATHFRLYPEMLVTGVMYDNQYRDPGDAFPRQGGAAFFSSLTRLWADVPPAEFDRNYLRTCVHELGHALNLLHSFDKDRPESASWMNYPWRYPYGYNLPPDWDGSRDFWRGFRFEFDAEELRHLRHHALMEVIPGGAAYGILGHDAPSPLVTAAYSEDHAPLTLQVRTRPERYLFHFAEPVTVEIKLKNHSKAAVTVPDMLSPEFGLLELLIRDPKGQVGAYRPLFRLDGEARMVELPPGGKLYESVFLAYGGDGFYFMEPGEYQIWAVYGAGGLRLQSNALRIRVAYPRTTEDEEMALWAFGRDQGHVLYMRGGDHLQAGQDQLDEVTERFPDTNLSRYIQYCLGLGQARTFKDVVRGVAREPQIEDAIERLERARAFSPRWEGHSSLDNIRHGRAANILSDLYARSGRPERAKSVLTQTAQYFTQMRVKPEVIQDFRVRAAALRGR
jgi:hypothetical protein